MKNTKKEQMVELNEKPHVLTAGQKFYMGLKAIADFLIALIGLIVLIPLFIIVAIAIKIDSKGPVFFTHKRVGKNGKEFTCIKFRSMAIEAKPDVAGYQYAEVNSYITRVGKVIRKLSIDELPQLFNMLTFKMSLIGYRPSQVSETELCTVRENHLVYQTRPGITGWAQINGRDVLAATPTKKALFDAYYVKKFSLWFDIKIFFLTIGKVFAESSIQEGEIPEAKEIETAIEPSVSISGEQIVDSEELKETAVAAAPILNEQSEEVV